MPGLLPDQSEVTALGQVLTPQLRVRLFQNDVIPGPNSVLSDFQAASFPGYADLTMQPGMSSPAINPVGQAQSVSDVLTWVRGAGLGTQTVFGYVVFHDPPGPAPIFGAERFTQPRVFSLAGQSLTLQIQVLLSTTL